MNDDGVAIDQRWQDKDTRGGVRTIVVVGVTPKYVAIETVSRHDEHGGRKPSNLRVTNVKREVFVKRFEKLG